MRSAIMKTKKADKNAKMRNTCTACRRAKTRCDRGAPRCNRCVRLDIPCIEQLRTQGRPVSLVPTSTEVGVVTVTASQDSSSSSNKRKATTSASVGSSRKRANKPGSRGSSAGLSARPMTFMIPVAADAMYARFNMLIKKGKINYKRAEAQLRSWGQRSVRLGKDASYGAVDRICKLMGLDAGGVAEEKGGLSSQPDAVLEDGSDSLHPGLRGLDDGSAMVACYVQERGRVCVWMNDQFTERLLSADEALRTLKEKQCLPVYMWGCLFTQESQQELYDSLASLYFSAAGEVGEVTHTLTCIGRDGITFRGLSRVRHLVDQTSRCSSCIISIIPLPGTPTSCSSPQAFVRTSPTKSRSSHKEPKPVSLSACCVANDTASYCSSGASSISDHISSGSSSPGSWSPSSSAPQSPASPVLPPPVLPTSPISMPVIAPPGALAPPQLPVLPPAPQYPPITCAPAPCLAPVMTFTTATTQPMQLPPLPPHSSIHPQLGPPLPPNRRDEDSYSGYPEGPPSLTPWGGRSRSAVEFSTTLSSLPSSSAVSAPTPGSALAVTAPDPLDIPTHMQSFDWERSDLLQGPEAAPPITPTVTGHHMAVPHPHPALTAAAPPTMGPATHHCHYVAGPPHVVEPASMGYLM